LQAAPRSALRQRATRDLHGVLEAIVLYEMGGVLRVHHLQQLAVRIGNLERLLPLAALHVQLAQQLDVSALLTG
jgi:hypothetical protein